MPFPELADILVWEQCETSGGYSVVNSSSKGPCILLTYVSENPSQEDS